MVLSDAPDDIHTNFTFFSRDLIATSISEVLTPNDWS
jgi:hypothetical protein